jgi:hypothetical protein
MDVCEPFSIVNEPTYPLIARVYLVQHKRYFHGSELIDFPTMFSHR